MNKILVVVVVVVVAATARKVTLRNLGWGTGGLRSQGPPPDPSARTHMGEGTRESHPHLYQ